MLWATYYIVGSETSTHNAVARNTQVLNVEGSSNYLYVLKKKTVYNSFLKNPDVFLNKGKSIITLKLDLIHLLNIFRDFCWFLTPGRHLSLVLKMEKLTKMVCISADNCFRILCYKKVKLQFPCKELMTFER